MLYVLALGAEHNSFHFGLRGHKFLCACLASAHVSAPNTIAASTHEIPIHVGFCLHNEEAEEELARLFLGISPFPMFVVCRPACHGSSLYHIVLVLFLETVVLPYVGPMRSI